MKKLAIILLVVLILLGVLFEIRFVVGGDEDTWLCQNGHWSEHGHPNAPMPTSQCK
jgi:hypothetical protein